MYQDGQRALQDKFDSRRLADRLEERMVQTELDEQDKAFIESQIMSSSRLPTRMAFPTARIKVGAPGFVRVLDPCTLAFPITTATACFCPSETCQEPARRSALHRLSGAQPVPRKRDATIDPNDPLLSEYPGAQMIVRVHVRGHSPTVALHPQDARR